VKKMDCYLQSWAVKGLDKTVDFQNIKKAMDFAWNYDVSKLKKNLADQSSLVEESFKKMLE